MRKNTKFICQKYYMLSTPYMLYFEPICFYKNRNVILKEEIKYFCEQLNTDDFIILDDKKRNTNFRVYGSKSIVDSTILWNVK